jgi:aldose sugar dehydrogenase
METKMRAQILMASLALAACTGSAPAQTDPSITREQAPAPKPFIETPVATLDEPWAMTFLPDNFLANGAPPAGGILITEKGGKLKLLSADGKTMQIVGNIPKVDSAGQGGLMDVVLGPDFGKTGLVYFSYVERGTGGKGVVLARGALGPDKSCATSPCPTQPHLFPVEILYRAHPYVSGDGHFSGRIAFSPDGKYLFFTNGERQKFDPAQDKTASLGKVLRLTLNGKPAPGNPLATQGFAPEIWSYGHRNLLGLAFDAKGRLWEQEMGPRGGDEVNIILPGKNYGWPIVSNGNHYDGRDIPDHPTRPEFEAPKVSWNPVISPSGLMIYTGKMFPQWNGNIFIGGLSSESLIRVTVSGDTAREAARYAMGKRIREVEQGPDGAIWLLEDGPRGRLLKLTPR